MYEYFISYAHGSGFGNCNATFKKEIKSMGDLTEAKRMIEEKSDVEDVIILYYCKLKLIRNSKRGSNKSCLV